jgi:hypothetical protein
MVFDGEAAETDAFRRASVAASIDDPVAMKNVFVDVTRSEKV